MFNSSISSSTIFRKVSLDVIEKLLSTQAVLEVMNEYTKERYGELFWYGGYTSDSFNSNYRLVCPPTAVDFDMSVGFPFFYKTVFLERVPFTEGKDSAKFGIHSKLSKPLLII